MEMICFHNPDEENGYLSNWYLSDFIIDNILYSSMEQYMMYNKAIYFHDQKTASLILETNNVSRIKELGRAVSYYNNQDWNGVRQIIVYKGLIEKFKQNQELKDKLINTGDILLAECAVNDKIWGIGLSMTDKNRYNQDKWKGKNLLGYTLMMVRSAIK